MKADTWMPFYIADYLRDTMRLGCLEHGAYMLLIMACWTDGGRLPNSAQELSSIAKLSSAEWEVVAPRILRFFTEQGDFLVHPRVAKERDKAQRLSEARRATGLKGGRPRKQSVSEQKPIGLANGNLEGSQTETPARVARPSPSSTEEMDANASLSTDVDEPKYPEAFEAAWRAYPHVKGRSSKPKSLACWRKLTAEHRAGLLPAVERFAREGREPRMDCGAAAMDRWLRDQKFLDWLAAPAAVAAPSVQCTEPWNGPPEVRAALVNQQGEDWTAQWLRTCRWQDVPVRALVTHRTLTKSRIELYAGHVLRAMGVQIILEETEAA